MSGVTLPVQFEVKAVQVGNSLKITIPKELTKHLKIKKGDTITLWSDDSHIIIEKKKE
jgi:putative addiction module antidote